MTMRKTLTSIVLAGALVLGVVGCKEGSQNNKQSSNPPYIQLDGGYGATMAAADFDGDNIPEILHNRGDGKVFLYKRNNLGQYTNQGQILQLDGGYGATMAAADFNGDGKPDILHNRGDGKVFLYINTGDYKFVKSSE